MQMLPSHVSQLTVHREQTLHMPSNSHLTPQLVHHQMIPSAQLPVHSRAQKHSGLPRQMKCEPTSQYQNVQPHYVPVKTESFVQHGVKNEPEAFAMHTMGMGMCGSSTMRQYSPYGTPTKVEPAYNAGMSGGTWKGGSRTTNSSTPVSYNTSLTTQAVSRTATQEEFTCPVKNCDKSYAYNSTLLRHIRSKHSIDEIRKSGFKMTV